MPRNMLRHFLRIVAPVVFVGSLLLFSAPSAHAATVGPKSHYLALGDSLAYGFQPDLDFSHGYAEDFYADLKNHGTSSYANLGCPGETSTSMINGGCTFSVLRKFPYIGSQLNAAVIYLKLNPGRVSPVTLDIGANDMLPDINKSSCTVDPKWPTDLAQMDTNLQQVILPKLSAAMTVNGQRTGDLLLMNYYYPYQNLCPTLLPYIQLFNQHLAADASGYATIVDVFTPFGGAATPNPNICSDTWMCSIFKDIHAKSAGYRVIANAFEQTAGY
ncbi:hypothetical protein KDA_37710 [Dictyobacter alpinus]|uniref:SGNH hydrolase-type esterase domain-containing protein n=1 Tax=Dictyobacter alpinus TaxID=2014873 RepID=A0A402BAG7_9CHLR|nr:SGNH/GDSL hydrolase family protein [Dictyobacter alpinus]GCE28287.1 hypothetical protein KDA_37710 [Dictyobacter alpinus]